jgi:hypothetical protein
MPEIEKIQNEWTKDCIMDRTELGEESIKTPNLYDKYLRYYTNEKLFLAKIKSDYHKIKVERWEYYSGKATVPSPTKILRQDLEMYLDADETLSKKKMLRTYQEEKVDLLEKILKSIERRGFAIKSAIDWERLVGGGF